jgi:diadenosine tetraphosphatase ApaH/serine/threonine PP2A family protein phosphatase
VKLALFADVHSNLEALQACLEHARAGGADEYAFLGDLVGYGADPEAVVEIVEGYTRDGAAVVRGNHDEAVVDEEKSVGMNAAAATAAAWTRIQLSPRQRVFLAGLPLTVRRDDVLFVHGSASAPDQFTYITDPRAAGGSLQAADGATYVFCGHVHEPVLYFQSAGARPLPFKPVPRDGNTAACYAMFDLERRTLTFHRVPYDWSGAARKILAAGLPERLAARLQKGE